MDTGDGLMEVVDGNLPEKIVGGGGNERRVNHQSQDRTNPVP